jgi:hypothetical protein
MTWRWFRSSSKFLPPSAILAQMHSNGHLRLKPSQVVRLVEQCRTADNQEQQLKAVALDDLYEIGKLLIKQSNGTLKN